MARRVPNRSGSPPARNFLEFNSLERPERECQDGDRGKKSKWLEVCQYVGFCRMRASFANATPKFSVPARALVVPLESKIAANGSRACAEAKNRTRAISSNRPRGAGHTWLVITGITAKNERRLRWCLVHSKLCARTYATLRICRSGGAMKSGPTGWRIFSRRMASIAEKSFLFRDQPLTSRTGSSCCG